MSPGSEENSNPLESESQPTHKLHEYWATSLTQSAFTSRSCPALRKEAQSPRPVVGFPIWGAHLNCPGPARAPLVIQRRPVTAEGWQDSGRPLSRGRSSARPKFLLPLSHFLFPFFLRFPSHGPFFRFHRFNMTGVQTGPKGPFRGLAYRDLRPGSNPGQIEPSVEFLPFAHMTAPSAR